MSILLTKRVVESLKLKLRYIPFGLVPLSYVYLHGAYDIGRHRNPPGQGYPTGVLTLPYSGSQGLRVKGPY
jgi:hypothetical protein